MHEVVLQFHDKKHADKVIRNLQKGKGVLIKPEHVGGGWLNTLQSVARTVAPIVAPIAKDVANKVIDAGVQRMQGNGLLGGIGQALGNFGDSKLGFGVKKRGRPKKGEGLLGDIGSALGNFGDSKLGFGVKKGKKSMKVPKSLEMYMHPHHGGSFQPL